MKGLRQLLSAVSRSFYLSMRFLPREMRPGVAVGYLLARATDTVADTVDMDCRERLALLRMMGATVAGDASREAAASCFGRLGILSTVQTHRGEAELLLEGAHQENAVGGEDKEQAQPGEGQYPAAQHQPVPHRRPGEGLGGGVDGHARPGVKVVAGGEHANRHQKHGEKGPASTLTLARERSRAARHTANTARLTAG